MHLAAAYCYYITKRVNGFKGSLQVARAGEVLF